jgi:hypothetical protein
MKKYLLPALVAGAMTLPSVGFAQSQYAPVGDPDGYSNRGQCQSALMRARNEDRVDNQYGYTNQEYNSKTRANFECQRIGERYYIVQVDSQ